MNPERTLIIGAIDRNHLMTAIKQKVVFILPQCPLFPRHRRKKTTMVTLATQGTYDIVISHSGC